ncbi:hypothetical protein TNCV_2515931 [Trichonephila clavipes]|nr:hypothetical protein TNCV_2515931 [Trichonephila clavipes]
MPSPGFEPRPYRTTVRVTNHYTGWAAHILHKPCQIQLKLSGHGSLVVKKMDFMTGLLCSSRVLLNTRRAEASDARENCRGIVPPVDVEWKLGYGVPAQLSSSLLDHGSKIRCLSPEILV